jgi:hypothetical protein
LAMRIVLLVGMSAVPRMPDPLLVCNADCHIYARAWLPP